MALTRVEGKIIVDGTTAVQSFEAGEVDTLDEQLPSEEIARLKDTPEYELYKGLSTSYYGFNNKKITDINQRRAMSLAVNRQEIIDNITQANEIPAKGFTPEGMPGFEEVVGEGSPWTPAEGDMEQAKAEMAKATKPVKNVTVFTNESPPNEDVAVALQSMWKELGITAKVKVMEWQQFLEMLGPPPPNSVDLYRLGWVGDFVDDINFLELWTCDSGNNNANYCDKSYDELVQKAKETPDNAARYRDLQAARGEADRRERRVADHPALVGDVQQPRAASRSRDTFNINLLDQVDLTQVEVKE